MPAFFKLGVGVRVGDQTAGSNGPGAFPVMSYSTCLSSKIFQFSPVFDEF